MPAPAPDTKLFISGLPVYLNVFDWGPCNSVRLVYRQPGITCVIYKSADETQKLFEQHAGPKLLLSYKNGNLIVLAAYSQKGNLPRWA